MFARIPSGQVFGLCRGEVWDLRSKAGLYSINQLASSFVDDDEFRVVVLCLK
jgi:hypothetical protein